MPTHEVTLGLGTTIAESREGFEQLLAGEDPIILFQGPKTKER